MPPFLLDPVSILAFFQNEVHLRFVGRKWQLFKAVCRVKRDDLIDMIDPYGAKHPEMLQLFLIHDVVSFSLSHFYFILFPCKNKKLPVQ